MEEQRSRSGERRWWRSRGSRSQSKHEEEVRGAEEQRSRSGERRWWRSRVSRSQSKHEEEVEVRGAE